MSNIIHLVGLLMLLNLLVPAIYVQTTADLPAEADPFVVLERCERLRTTADRANFCETQRRDLIKFLIYSTWTALEIHIQRNHYLSPWLSPPRG